jgi:hypothetical protein
MMSAKRTIRGFWRPQAFARGLSRQKVRRAVEIASEMLSEERPYQLLALAPDSIARSYARPEREATFNLLHAGDIFGEITLLDGQPPHRQCDRKQAGGVSSLQHPCVFVMMATFRPTECQMAFS